MWIPIPCQWMTSEQPRSARYKVPDPEYTEAGAELRRVGLASSWVWVRIGFGLDFDRVGFGFGLDRISV